MDHIVIDGSNPWRGRYEFDLAESVETLTLSEWGWIKKLGGYLPATIGEGLAGADAELIGTLAVIALCRNGKIDKRDVPDVFERLVDSPYTAVTIEFGDVSPEKGDAGPPASANRNGTTSGPGSPTSSETSPPHPPVSGSPSSDTSPSVPATSAT